NKKDETGEGARAPHHHHHRPPYPAAGRAVSASNDASTAGTKIRTRAFIKFLLPLASPDPYSLGSLFTRLDGRNQEGLVKALPIRADVPQYQTGGDVADRST